MTQDPILDIFREYEYEDEIEALAAIGESTANMAYFKRESRRTEEDVAFTRAVYSAADARRVLKYSAENLQNAAFRNLKPIAESESITDFVIERVSALNPVHKRLFETKQELQQLDAKIISELNFSAKDFIETFFREERDPSKIVNAIKLVLENNNLDTSSPELKQIKYKTEGRRIFSSPLLQEFIKIYLEYLALEDLIKVVISQTLDSLKVGASLDEQLIYIDLVFDYLTDPTDPQPVLPETIDYVLDIFLDYVKDAKFIYNPDLTVDPTPAGNIVYATLRGNEERLLAYEQRFGELNLNLFVKLKRIESLIKNTDENKQLAERRRKVENMEATMSEIEMIFTTIGLSTDRMEKIFKSIPVNRLKNQVDSFQRISDYRDLITFTTYLLSFMEGKFEYFHAFDRHSQSVSQTEMLNLFARDATRTVHGIFSDDLFMGRAFVSSRKRLLEILSAKIDRSKPYSDYIDIEFPEEVGDVYKRYRDKSGNDRIVKVGRTKKVRISINHVPGWTPKQSIISIYPLGE